MLWGGVPGRREGAPAGHGQGGRKGCGGQGSAGDAREPHPSQRHRLAEDSVTHVPVEGSPGTEVDFHAEQFLEILHQSSVVQEAPAGFPGDEQIQVTVLIGFAAGHGAEYAQSVGAAPGGERLSLGMVASP